MIKRPYLPTNELERMAWMEQLGIKAPVYATLLGITSVELTAINSDILLCKALISQINAIINELKKRVTYKNILLYGDLTQVLGAFPTMVAFTAPTATSTAGALTRICKIMDRVKGSANYTPAIGRDMGIEPLAAPLAAVSAQESIPEFTLTSNAGQPLLRFIKLQRRVVDIYVERVSGQGFSFMTSCSYSTFTDTHPLPENVTSAVWNYKIIYRNREGQFGDFSRVQTIAVKSINAS
jgi:hypothetical protein